MSSFPMSVANNFCDLPLSKYLDSKTVLIYCPHPVGDSIAKERLHRDRADLGGYDIGNFRFRWKNTIITIEGRL